MNDDAIEKTKQIVEDLHLSSDEIDKLTNAFKNPEFKKLFQEYAEEISDPENKKRYEEEIRMMESDRGMNVEFINPSPGYVIKTGLSGQKKAFVNICHSEKIEKPKVKRSNENKAGVLWSIPHSFSPPREDFDKNRSLCMVYDVVFHPDTLHMAKKNARYREMIESTALDGIEKNFTVKLDRKNIRRPKLSYKGAPVTTVIRNKQPDFDEKQKELSDVKAQDPLLFPYPYDKTKPSPSSTDQEGVSSNKSAASDKHSDYATPEYTISYSEDFDLQNFHIGAGSDQQSQMNRRPNQIIVNVRLPLLKSAACIDLDVKERQLKLHVEKPSAYHLDVKLSYPVLEDQGTAKFDKSTRQLKITLPIVPIKNSSSTTISTVDDDDDNLVEVEESSELSNNLPPLIEVISSVENSQNLIESIKSNIENEIDTISVPITNTNDLVTMCKHQLAFQEIVARQNCHSIIVCLRAMHILDKSIRLFYNANDRPNCLLIQCTSQAPSGCFPMLLGVFFVAVDAGDEWNFVNESVQYKVHQHSLCVHLPKLKDGYWTRLSYCHQPQELDSKDLKTWNFDDVSAVDLHRRKIKSFLEEIKNNFQDQGEDIVLQPEEKVGEGDVKEGVGAEDIKLNDVDVEIKQEINTTAAVNSNGDAILEQHDDDDPRPNDVLETVDAKNVADCQVLPVVVDNKSVAPSTMVNHENVSSSGWRQISPAPVLHDVTGGELIRDHKTDSVVPLNMDIVLELDTDD